MSIWCINHMCTYILQCSLTDWQCNHIGRMVQSVFILIWSLREREDLSSQDSILLLEGYSRHDAFIAHIWKTCAEHILDIKLQKSRIFPSFHKITNLNSSVANRLFCSYGDLICKNLLICKKHSSSELVRS